MDTTRAGLERLKLHCDPEWPRRIVHAMSAETRSVAEYIDRVAREDDGAWWYDEFQVIEDALGAALVVLQARMTTVISIAWKLYEAKGLHEASGWRRPGLRDYLLDLGPKAVPGVTKARAIEACANFFKHQDEWPSDWAQDGAHKKTAPVVIALGVEKGQVAHSLRTATGKLGVTSADHFSLTPLLQAYEEWTAAVIAQANKWVGR